MALRRLLQAAATCCAVGLSSCRAGGARLGDAAALLQASLRAHPDEAPAVSTAVHDAREGPVAHTPDGPILGVYQDQDRIRVFKRIPYVEPPERFAKALPKRPWAPDTLKATEYGPGCIGSHTGVPEDENCLNLNIWVPPGSHTNMPVLVYFHGGMNQHGSGQEPLRQGDGVVRSAKYPTIFINFDFRLGIFGWIRGGRLNVTDNLGLHDQQAALRWVQRNIRAFGGDPHQVTLQGQSEGAGAILVHMVSPGSAGLFDRVIFHSPPADIWSRTVNEERTAFILNGTGCSGQQDELACLKRLPAQRIWDADWVSEELSRNVGSWLWVQNAMALYRFQQNTNMDARELPKYLGWHAVVDGDNVPGEPRQLIARGKWHKVPVLITVSKNESYGVFPGAQGRDLLTWTLTEAVSTFSQKRDLPRLESDYNASLRGASFHDRIKLLHAMATDRMWTCHARSFAADIVNSGAQAYVGMFWHSPRWDPVGVGTNVECLSGATCHASEMMYVLQQGRGRGIPGWLMAREKAFADRYMDEVLSFVNGTPAPESWVPYSTATQPMTFHDTTETRLVERYREEQCAVLGSSTADVLPE